MKKAFTFSLLVCMTLILSIAWSDIIYVPGDQPTIQAAIDAAIDGDTVLVANGTYTGDGNRDIDFNGKAITVKSENGADNCIIECEGTEQDPHRGFYFHSGETENTVVDGFKIQNGYVNTYGGAIYCASSPTLCNCIITGNSACDGAGGIYCESSSPKVTNCTITGNSALDGGGIRCKDSSLTLTNCTITENDAGAGSGGGILCWESSSLTLINSTIIGNTAAFGGGIEFFGSLTLTKCTIIGNTVCCDGGGILCGGSLTLTNCSITGNSADGSGGGICCWDCSLTLQNCTITDNSAAEGGGIDCENSSSPTLSNCILWGDSPQEIYFSEWRDPNTVTISYSDVQGGEAGIVTNDNGTVNWLEGNIDEDPLFVDADNDDYHLQAGSPCIDAGTPEGAPPDDIEGNPRDEFPDMGAYEFQGGEVDTTPPSAITDLATSNTTADSITLIWTAPGDDGDVGQASEYDIRYSTSPIDEANWNSATQVDDEPPPQPAGSSESFVVNNLSPETTYYFAMKTADEVPNWSDLSNVAFGSKLSLNDIVGVNRTNDLGLSVRDEAGTSGTTKLKVIPDGWKFRIIDGPVFEDNYTWWKIRDEKHETSPIEGWTVEDYLVKDSPENFVPPEAPGYFSSNQAKIEDAISQAKDQEGKTDWAGWCLKFVRESFEGDPIEGWTSAEAARQQLENEGKFYSWVNCWNPPRGALIFFSALGEYEPDGHVGIYLGDQGIVHSYDKVRIDKKQDNKSKGIVTVENLSLIDSYIGWAYPPQEWTGTSLSGEPSIAVSPDSIDFGGVAVGDEVEENLLIYNDGDADLTVEGITSDNPAFTIVSPTFPQNILPADSIDVTVRFSPLSEGFYTGTLTIASNDPDEPEVSVSVEGTGIQLIYSEDFSSDPNFTALAPEYAYWDAGQGNYYVKTFDNLEHKYWAYSPSFGPVDIDNDFTLEFNVMFENQDWGTYPAVSFYSAEPTSEELPHSHNIPYVLSVINAYSNNYYKKLMFRDCHHGHSYSYLTDTIEDNVWYNVKIEYHATTLTADLYVYEVDSGNQFYSNKGVPFEVSEDIRYLGVGYYDQPNYGSDWSPIRLDNVKISGKFQVSGEPSITVSPGSIDFGDVSVGNKVEENLLIYNDGDADLAVEGITSDNPNFTIVSPNFPQNILPGDSIDVTVRFSPSSESSYTGTLTVASNDPDEPELFISIEGMGIQLGPGGVVLSRGSYIRGVDFPNDESMLAYGGDEKVYIYDSTNWTLIKEISVNPGTGSGIRDVDFSPSGRWLAVAKDNQAYVYRTGDWTQVSGSPFGANAKVISISFSSTGKWLAYGTRWADADIYIYDTENWKKVTQFAASNDKNSVDFSPSEDFIAFTSKYEYKPKIRRTTDWSRVATLNGGYGEYDKDTRWFDIKFSPNEQWVSYGFMDRTDGKRMLLLHAVGGDWTLLDSDSWMSVSSPFNSVALDFSPDSKLIAYGADNIRFYRVEGTPIHLNLIKEIEVSGAILSQSLEFSESGRWLAYSNGEDVYVRNVSDIVPPVNQPPDQPTNTSPEDVATDVNPTSYVLEASTFSDPDGDSHLASQWQIREDSGSYDNPVFDKEVKVVDHLTSIPLPYPDSSGELDYGKTYYWRVRYQDDHDAWSDWSGGTSFTTIKPEFRFVHITDVHIGWEEEEGTPPSADSTIPYIIKGYPNFTDTLRSINEDVNPKPDFILIGGDNVEWAKPEYFEMFKNALNNDNILPTYIVPGNHDRYEHSPFLTAVEQGLHIGGNEQLEQYYNFMQGLQISDAIKSPDIDENLKILLGFEHYSPPDSNIDFGLDRYNYYFERKGYLFIGLDSGADYMGDYGLEDYKKFNPSDFGPEGAGLHDFHIKSLEFLDKNIPKIIFMHHPIFTGKDDGEFEDASIVNKHNQFVEYCEENNVRLVLSGHTHESHIFDKDRIELSDDESDRFNNLNGLPLFVQTPSATKDNTASSGEDFLHGYRVIDVLGGVVEVRSYTPTPLYDRIVKSAIGPVNLHVYDSEGRHTGFSSIEVNIPDSSYTGYYNSSTPQMIILYNISEDYRYEVKGTDEESYGLTISSYENGQTTNFIAAEIPISPKTVHQYTIDWEMLTQSEEGVTVQIDSEGDGEFEQSITSDNELTQSEFLSATTPLADLRAINYRFGEPAPGYNMDNFPIYKYWMNVEIENIGDGDASNVTASISSGPPNGTIIDGDVTVGDIPAGESAWSSDTYTIELDLMQPGPGADQGITWKIEYEDGSGTPHVIEDVPEFPAAPALKRDARWFIVVPKTKVYQNYPNPWNPETWIPYQLSSPSDVMIKIYNIKGELIKSLDLGSKQPGFYISRDSAAYWNGRNDTGESVSSGIYFYQIEAGKFNELKKMVILK